MRNFSPLQINGPLSHEIYRAQFLYQLIEKHISFLELMFLSTAAADYKLMMAFTGLIISQGQPAAACKHEQCIPRTASLSHNI